MEYLNKIGAAAKKASYELSALSTDKKNEALRLIAEELIKQADYIIEENKKDLEAASAAGVKSNMLDRRMLDEKRIAGIAEGVKQVAALSDPIGEVIHAEKRPNGLLVAKTRVPLGVIAIIYEARPNVTADAAALTLKYGNAVILRGGKEAIRSNIALGNIMRQALKSCGMMRMRFR